MLYKFKKTDPTQVKTHQTDDINFKCSPQNKSIEQLQTHPHTSLLIIIYISRFKKQNIVNFLPK